MCHMKIFYSVLISLSLNSSIRTAKPGVRQYSFGLTVSLPRVRQRARLAFMKPTPRVARLTLRKVLGRLNYDLDDR
jgi:hypothetical protein